MSPRQLHNEGWIASPLFQEVLVVGQGFFQQFTLEQIGGRCVAQFDRAHPVEQFVDRFMPLLESFFSADGNQLWPGRRSSASTALISARFFWS